MIIFLHGPDTFRSHRKLRALKDRYLSEIDKTGADFKMLEGAALDAAAFHDAVGTASLFASKRMVVAENLLSKGKSEAVKEIGERMLSGKVPREVILVLRETEEVPGPRKRSKVYKKLAAEKFSQRFDFLSNTQLEQWIRQEVADRGSHIEAQAVRLIASFVGNNLWQLSGEIDKLIAYNMRGEKQRLDRKEEDVEIDKITARDVKDLVSAKADDNIFAFVDAMGSRNRREAYRLLHDQLASGAGEHYLMSMIVRQFRILLSAKELSGQGMTSRQIAPKLGLHPFVVQKAVAQCQKYTLAELVCAYRDLLDLDIGLKTGRADSLALLDLFLARAMA